MNKELKEKWIENLRSGKFKQGRSALNRENSFCCLGVLCETMNLFKRKEGFCIQYSQFIDRGYVGDYLPHGISDLLGLNRVIEDDKTTIEIKLSIMNDTRKTFNEIADWIEKNL